MTAVTTRGREDTAVYVFAVSRECDPAVLEGLAGHGEGGPVRSLLAGSLTAVVQDVPAAGFSEDVLQQRLSDREELERCVRAHHGVVTALAAAVPTVPLPLATLYLGEERARTALGDREPRFRAALDRITGRVEWGVKVYALPEPAAPAGPDATAERPTPVAVTSAGPPSPSPGAGRAYLDRIRGRQQARQVRYDTALRTAEEVDAALRRQVVAGRRLRLHGPETDGERRTQVLNAAYLAERGADRELAAAIEPFRGAPGIRIEVTGPWVPYSFTHEGGDG